MTGLPASIRARLLTFAQNKGEDYQRVLGRHAIERFPVPPGPLTPSRPVVLKGAMLFTLWTGETHRPTKDLVCELGTRKTFWRTVETYLTKWEN